ncbi:ABC transporter permease [Chryseolinea sp. T2]|uniref:ABC transporter permease n=1 Tax=Chryseolinea sp. T2 TaxID=3129255 RepID=UPI003077ACC4
MSDRKTDIKPPSLPLKALRWFCDPELLEDLEGDLSELFYSRVSENVRRAKLLYALDVLLLFRPGIIKRFGQFNHINNSDMLLNHITTALRQATKHKGYTAINIAGLVVGLSSCMLILLWVADETSRDQFHAKGDRMYEVWRNLVQSNGDIQTTNGIPLPLEHVLRTQYPDVDAVTSFTWEMESMFRLGEVSSFEKGRFATPGFFDVFSYPLIVGDPKKVLIDAPTMVISDKMALKFFGNDWREKAIGQTLRLDDREDFEVTGVFSIPANASLQFDWLVAAQSFIDRSSWASSWYNGGFSMFATLKAGANVQAVRDRIGTEVIRNTNHESNEPLYLQLFRENYLHGTFENGVPAGGRIQYVRILSAIAVFLLLLAAINFMNMATARASLRAREVGMRKVMGAQRSTLSLQFITEASMYAVVSTLLASITTYILLPYFNSLTGKSIHIQFSDPGVWAAFGGMVILTALLSGLYPAFMLSSFSAARSLKGKTKHGGSSSFRHALVTFQFAISIFLVSGTLIISKQLSYILHKDIGLKRENVVSLELSGELARKKEVYMNSLRSVPDVQSVTITNSSPVNLDMSTGGAKWPGKDPNLKIEINVISVGEDFVKTMGMSVVKGEDFSNVFLRDSARFLINEVFAGIMGYDDPTGRELTLWGTTGTIAGVVKDFHMSSLYDPIAPLIVRYDPKDTYTAFVRVNGNLHTIIAEIERITKDINPAFPFRYDFLDEDFARQYKSEQSVSSLVNIFAGVSIFIACLGLLGLSSFSADQRAKEIGIRKVHGASISALVLLLSKQYATLMVLAFIVATPLSWLYMNRWLGDFSYHIDMSIILFIVAGLVTFIIGALTIGYKSYAAAAANPMKTLNEE